MTNRGPFFNPFIGYIDNEQNNKITNKIERLEKEIRILENRVNKLEKVDNRPKSIEKETDMYML